MNTLSRAGRHNLCSRHRHHHNCHTHDPVVGFWALRMDLWSRDHSLVLVEVRLCYRKDHHIFVAEVDRSREEEFVVHSRAQSTRHMEEVVDYLVNVRDIPVDYILEEGEGLGDHSSHQAAGHICHGQEETAGDRLSGLSHPGYQQHNGQ